VGGPRRKTHNSYLFGGGGEKSEYFRDFDLVGRTAKITGFLLFYFSPILFAALKNLKKNFFFFCIEACKP